ncbi:MAG: HEAT repeat domain-containing protein [Planctomycetota bacterium]|jgi:HEAT repeat protein
MENKSSLKWAMTAVLLFGSGLFAATVEENWNDFLHYTAIGRYKLAQSYGEQLVADQPDPTVLLELAESDKYAQGYQLLLKMYADSEQLREISGKILDLIEEGRYIRRTDPKIILAEIKRLSSTIRGRIAAEERLRNAGEYAVPFMLGALADESRKNEFSYITEALPKVGRSAIRPLVAALQMEDVAIKIEIVRALGAIGDFEPLPHLKLIVETDSSQQLKDQASHAIQQINPDMMQISAAELFFILGEKYYAQDDSLASPAEFEFANIWFFDAEKQALIRQEIDKRYFDEMMAMRSCEWALKADAGIGKAIGLWIASFFRAESVGIAMPAYFDQGHADAMTYATTAGAEYLHQALERALNDEDAYVALGVVEAMAMNAGEKSLLYRVGAEQPLAKALDFADRKVRYSAAIAFAEANPVIEFINSKLIVRNLSEAILGQGADEVGDELSSQYALRAIASMYKLVLTRNEIIDLAEAGAALMEVTQTDNPVMQVQAAQVLAHLESPEAQRAIAEMAMNEANSNDIRISQD